MQYIRGGYPENFAEELSNNKEMIQSIRENYEQGKNILAECGGFYVFEPCHRAKKMKLFIKCVGLFLAL